MNEFFITRPATFDTQKSQPLVLFFAKKRLRSISMAREIRSFGVGVNLVDTQREFIRVLKSREILMIILEDELVRSSNIDSELFYGLLSMTKVPIKIGVGEDEELQKIKNIDFDSILSSQYSMDFALNEIEVYCEACKIIQSSQNRVKSFANSDFDMEKFQEKIQEELQHKNRKISSLYMQIIEYKNRLKRSFSEWESLGFSLTDDKIRRFHFSLKSYSKEVNNNWEIFSEHFVEVHPAFFDKLKKMAPNLSDENLKMCAYIKMGIGNHEIAKYMNILHGSVKRAQVRIKKKLNLRQEVSLRNYIQDIH